MSVKVFFIFMAIIMFAFGFFIWNQTFTGHEICTFVSIGVGLIALAKTFMFGDTD